MSAPKRVKLIESNPAIAVLSEPITKILLIHERDTYYPADDEEEDNVTKFKVVRCNPTPNVARLLKFSEEYRPEEYKGANYQYTLLSYVEWKYGHLGKWCYGDPRVDEYDEMFGKVEPGSELHPIMEKAVKAKKQVLDEWIKSHDYVFAYAYIDSKDNCLEEMVDEYLEHIRDQDDTVKDQVADFFA